MIREDRELLAELVRLNGDIASLASRIMNAVPVLVSRSAMRCA